MDEKIGLRNWIKLEMEREYGIVLYSFLCIKETGRPASIICTFLFGFGIIGNKFGNRICEEKR